MEGARSLWTDVRLDDAFREVRDRVRLVETISSGLTALEVEQRGVIAEQAAIHSGIERLNARLDRRDEERAHERELAVQHRREDRRFTATLTVSVAAILLTAVGILVSVLS